MGDLVELTLDMEVPTIEASFDTEVPQIEADMESQQSSVEASFDTREPNIEADFQINVLNTDHDVLQNRDLPNQHPMGAITGLDEKLSSIDSEIDTIEENMVSEVVGGSNISVSREGNTVTLNSSSFVFEQGIASDTWEINHNLNKRPSIMLADSSGRVFEADREYVNNNKVIIHLQSATTGFAYLN